MGNLGEQKAVANRMYVKWKDDKQQTSLDAVKTKFAGRSFLIKSNIYRRKTLYDWFFPKGDLCIMSCNRRVRRNNQPIKTPFYKNTWSLDPKFLGQY